MPRKIIELTPHQLVNLVVVVQVEVVELVQKYLEH